MHVGLAVMGTGEHGRHGVDPVLLLGGIGVDDEAGAVCRRRGSTQSSRAPRRQRAVQVGALFSTSLDAVCLHRTCHQTRFSTSSWPRVMTRNWRPFEKMFPQLYIVPGALTAC